MAKYEKLNEDEVYDLLSYISNKDYDLWWKVGETLKSNGYSFQLWDDWSKGADDYKERDCITQWNSFKKDFSMGYLVNRAKDNGYIRERVSVNHDNKYYKDRDKFINKIQEYHNKLKDQDREYLHNRGIKDTTIDSLQIGACINQEIIDGKKHNVRRLTIPIYYNGFPKYLNARLMSEVEGASKYRKLPIKDNTYVDNCISGADTLSRNNDFIVICEGCFDFLSLWQEGYTVLSSQTKLSQEHTKYLIRAMHNKKFKKVIICYDNDERGQSFADALENDLFKNGILFEVVNIPNNYRGYPIKDISDWYSLGESLSVLLEKYTIDGIKDYLSKNDYYDILDILDEKAPYLSRDFKSKVTEYYSNELSKEQSMELKKALNRAKRDGEWAREFKAYYPNELVYSTIYGYFEFIEGKYWRKIDRKYLQQYFQEVFDGRNKIQARLMNDIFKMLEGLCYKDVHFNETNGLNFANGTLYFDYENKDKPLRFTETHNPQDYFNYYLDYDCPIAEPQDTRFIQMIVGICNEDLNLAYRVFEYYGACFIPQTIEKKAFMFYGDGNNGKSKLTEVFENTLPSELVCNLTLKSIKNSQYALAELDGKWVNFAHDDNGSAVGIEDDIKGLLDNNRKRVNHKGTDFIELRPRANWFFDVNELPRSNDRSEGWLTRFEGTTHKMRNTFTTHEEKVDEDNHIFKADVTLKDYIETIECKKVCMWYAIEGYKRVVANGLKFTPIAEDKEVTLELSATSNSLIEFVKDFDWKYNNMQLESMNSFQLYEKYKEWAEANGITKTYMLLKTSFEKQIGKAFETLGTAKHVKSNGYMVYKRVHCEK